MANAKRFKMKYTFDDATRVHEWQFPGTNLPPVRYTQPEVVAANSTEDAIVQPATRLGFKQTVANAAALSHSDDGKEAPVADKHAAMLDRIAILTSLRWSGDRVAAKIVVGALVSAICQITGKSEEGVRAYVDGLDEPKRAAFAASEKFGVAYAAAVATMRIRATLSDDDEAELDAVE